MGKLNNKIFSIAIFTISVLMISGAAQNVYAGSSTPPPFSMHVWSGEGANDNWDNPDNWFAGNVPEVTETLSHGTIYIGCDFAPTPAGEGPAPFNVNVLLGTTENSIEQTIVSPDNDGLMLCQGSTLRIHENSAIEFLPFIPASPIFVSHTNFGTIINNGFFGVFNPFANNDYIEVHLHNEGSITNTATGTIRVENNGANTADIEVQLTNDLSTSFISNAGLFVVANNGAVSPPNAQTSEVDIFIENDGGTISISGTLRLENTAPITNDMGNGVILDIEVKHDDGSLTIEEDGTFTMQNTAAGVITNGNGLPGNSGAEVNVVFDEPDALITIKDDGLLEMRNDGEIIDDENADLDIKFDENFDTIDIKEGGLLLMENTADLTTTAGSSPQDAQVQILFEDQEGTILNAGTLEMKNSGNVVAPCDADIEIQFDDNEGPINNSGTILMENTGDATDTDCGGDTSEIDVEIRNDGDDAVLTNQADGEITLWNDGTAERIDVELENHNGGTVSNSGEFNIINDEGDATVELDVGIENGDGEEDPSVINNQCGGTFNIENTDDSADVKDVGVENDGSTINNFGTGKITVDDDGDVTENFGIAVVGDPINFIATCQGGSQPDVYVVMGSFGNTNPEDGSLAQADLNTGDLIQVGSAIATEISSVDEGFLDGLSGLAIDSNGRFFVTAVQEGDPSVLAQVDPLTGAIIDEVGRNQIPPVGDDTNPPEDVKIRDLSFQPGTNDLFGVGRADFGPSNALFKIDTSDATVEVVSVFEGVGTMQGLAFDPTDGTLYGTSRGEGCALWTFDTTEALSGFMPDLVTGLDRCYDGLGIDKDGNIYGTSQGDSLHLIDPSDGSDITVAGEGTNPSDVDFRDKRQSTGNGGLPYPDPNLGDPKHGQGHPDGFCMGQNCMDVTGLFNHWPETNVPQGSTQSFTLLISCPRGAHTCDHIALAGALPDADFYDDRWTVSLDKHPTSDIWDISIMNDYGEIDADGVTATVQVISQTMITSTINVPFVLPGSIGTADGVDAAHENNRHLHVTVHDNHAGSSNYIFNEGMYVEDIYAYPLIEMSFDSALEYEPLCLNEDSTKRHTCAFDKVKDWTIKNAEEKLKEMYDQRGQDMDSYDESEEYNK